MSLPQLDLPTIQNWSCHNCGGCCKQHGIYITDEEHQRIANQNWTSADGIPEGQPIFVRMGGWLEKKWWRLAHQPDGSCVFLDERGLCRIHGKFGEPAKPLACRIYPYTFHPRGKELVVSLRFSCPSVVSNLGKPVSAQRQDLKELASLILKDRSTNWPAPRLTVKTQLDWPDTLRIVNALERTITQGDVAFEQRLREALFWMNLIDQATFETVRGARLDELLDLITQAAAHEISEEKQQLDAPSSLGRLQFRLLAGHYARKDAYDSGYGTWKGRWQLLRMAMKLTSGKGLLPQIQPCFKEVPFEELEKSFGELPEGTDELFTRYFQVKIHGMHFCGPAYYGVPVVEGFYSLVLVYPAILWIARWLAASSSRIHLLLTDIEQALTIADHHHGFSQAFGTWGFRSRVNTLARLGEIAKLVAWYSR